MNYIFIILAFVISVFIARLIIPRILMISLRKKLFDIPDERKIHKRAIPRLGGVSFFPTILFSCCIVLAFRTLTGYSISTVQTIYVLPEYLLLVCGMVLLYLTGIADDLMGVRYRQKFVIQIICACFFSIAGLWINNLYGLCGIYFLPAWIGIPLTILIVVFINKGLWSYSMIAFSTVGVLVPFFYYNVFGSAERDRKIFMGDTGSLTLGYILSFLAIKYSQNNETVTSYAEGAFVIAFSTLIVPAFDVIRVVIVRVRNRTSPFEPDKNHIHHKFLAMGFTPRRAMVVILMISCGFSGANILLMPYVDNTIMLVMDIIVWIGLNLWWDKVRDRKKYSS